jgi:hypothetical protein
MNQKEAERLLDETFNRKFELEKFSVFLNELFNGFYKQDRSIQANKEYEQNISSIRKIGEHREGNRLMEVLVVELKKGSSLDRARALQRNAVAKLLSKFSTDSALVAFVSEDSPDWRFSFIKMDYKLTEEGKISKELTPAKRYSFLVGPNEPNHTCRSQFVELIKEEENKPTIDEIEHAFSIEKVTKEFFEKYKGLFLNLKENLDKLLEKDSNLKEEFEERQISTVDFSKKLLGQIVFLYFLQKKGWLGVKKSKSGKFEKWGLGPKNFMQELFRTAKSERKNFFNDYLEPLFYEALAEDRRANNNYYSRFDCRIPFLNGGLFEPINNYNWGETDINLDNEIFEEILGTFNLFNFTIKEDEPLEKEVAVDPEMLGKVFENLLDVIDRKSKGAFYTPREIVHYMCQQSLINYLETNTKISKKDIEIFIQRGDLALEYLRRQEIGRLNESEKSLVLPNTISKNSKEIDRLLTEIKICDPAVGSGAFPVGMMNEIVNARNILSYFLNKSRTDYDLKRETIENSLYGVDIEPSAVEITKLRFWLSLIVDEEDMGNIKPLPNLENRIMCGNSLIEEFNGIKLYIDPQEIRETKEKQSTLDQAMNKQIKQSEQKLKELRKKQKEFFNEQNRTKKNDLKTEIDKMEWDFIETSLKEQGDGENLKKLEQYRRGRSKPFFLWKLYFSDVFNRDNPGFDVVIANPPYFNIRKDLQLQKQCKAIYPEIYNGQNDILYYFIVKGLNLLRNNGVLTNIIARYFIEADSANKFRSYLLNSSSINCIIDFGNNQLFDEVNVLNTIIILEKRLDKSNYLGVFKFEDNFTPSQITEEIDGNFQKKRAICMKIYQENLGGEVWIFLPDNVKRIISKIEENSFNLGKIAKTGAGIQSGLNSIFVVDEDTIKEFKLEKQLLRNYCKTRDIKPYYIINRRLKVIRLTNNENIDDYPNTKKYLTQYKDLLEKRYEAKKKICKWYSFSVPRNLDIFDSKEEKIITPIYSTTNKFGYDNASKDCNFLTLSDTAVIKLTDNKYYTKSILGLLNSSLMNFYYHKTKKLKRDGYYEYLSKTLNTLPLRYDDSIDLDIIPLVDKILEITDDEDYIKKPEKQAKVKAYQKKIDKIVYELYKLTPEEIKTVENEA